MGYTLAVLTSNNVPPLNEDETLSEMLSDLFSWASLWVPDRRESDEAKLSETPSRLMLILNPLRTHCHWHLLDLHVVAQTRTIRP